MFQFFLALLAGIVTIGGPCILPLLPIILGTSTTGRHALRPVMIVLGFILSFSAFALLFSVFGSVLGLSQQTWRYVAVVAISAFGLLMIFPSVQAKLLAGFENRVSRLVSPNKQINRTGLLSGFVLGASLGALWTPCAGPVLGSILTLVASKQNLAQAGALLFAFALGAGIPMLLIAYGGQLAVQKISRLAKYTGLIQKIFGVIMLLTAIAIATNADQSAQMCLVQKYPWLFPANFIGL